MRKFTYISLFSSAGVGCYGFKMADFECVATCELLASRMSVQKANSKCKYESGYIVGDIKSSVIKQRLFDEIAFWQKTEKISDIDVIVATPPCQGMSTANYKKGDETKRNSLVVEAISIIKQVKPRIFVFENVSAFLKTICTDVDNSTVTIQESINKNLSSEYYIYSKVVNFKDYGVPSSRPRTLVIATRKDCINMSPLNIFPLKEKEITVREAIGDLSSLSFGEISDNDVYHMFREYPKYMEDWIRHIKEGESAFNNEEKYLPYKLVDGKKQILKGGYMGNKFKRLFWDKPCACIATRNDQLASQSTIHPKDNRVLSIRELMRLMTIPNCFRWSEFDVSLLDTFAKKKRFLKSNELNIRRCIGEAVPTHIMYTIACRAKEMLEFQDFVECYYKDSKYALSAYGRNFYIDTFIAEQNLSNTKKTGSYYTPQSVVYEALSAYKYDDGQDLNVLEPSVGLGAFLPQLFVLLQDAGHVRLDLCDIDNQALFNLQSYLSQINIDMNKFEINYVCDDFITTRKIRQKYDLIVSNPPFVDALKNNVDDYKKNTKLSKTKNLFAFFLAKFLDLSHEIIVILPKSFLMATEYDEIRERYQALGIVKIVDFGVKYFKKVFVEIISIHFKKEHNADLIVESRLSNQAFYHPQNYIFHDKCWLIYRDIWFDNYISNLKLDVFTFFRDRQITNKYLSDTGKVRVLRSKNILYNGEIINIPSYDKFINEDTLSGLTVSKYINSRCIIMPNFTYNTRASILPDNCVPNGSIAILLPKNDEILANIDLSYYATDDFRKYYGIVKNNSKFTINIDKNSIYYIGVLK